MIETIKSLATHTYRLTAYKLDQVKHSSARSPAWEKFSKDFIQTHPTCAACGSTAGVVPHHILPFHIYPEHELDEHNLITLCMAKDKHCHLLIGHGDSFRAWVAEVRELAAQVLQSPKDYDKICKQAVEARKVSI